MNAEVKDGTVTDVEMVNIEVDGVAMQAPKGSMIIQATDKAGIDIPRFCYHRKLSIAANCRMCLVDVEKAPKPMPACATPVMEGMKVFTGSRRAIDAQHGVMEFLLINHPLDCPICDQGGECELQDLAMGYGRSVSRFTERKRVVKDKNVGALVQTEMTRCIHCTRCVRFLEEIAGTTEMGGCGRGDRLEIGTCVENSIDSELSGNIIDLCPVGALTDKPFRFSARAWELMARSSISPHDGVGSALYHHARNGRILRTVSRDNEARNETWLADRDRYSRDGLYAADRVAQPMIKVNGQWQDASWDEAVTKAADALRDAGDELQTLMSPSAATEEYYLAQKLVRGLGSEHIDHRLREQDFSDDASRPAAPVFEMSIARMEQADAVLLLGCNPRHEAPLLGHRVRKAWQKGAVIDAINPLDWEFIFDIRENRVVAPQHMLAELAGVALAVADSSGKALPEQLARLAEGVKSSPQQQSMAQALAGAQQGLLLLGQFAMSHPQASALRALAAWVSENTGSSLNLVSHGANSVGAWQAAAVPRGSAASATRQAGRNAREMLAQTGKTWLLWGFEPDFDVDSPAAAMAALRSAGQVVAVASFASDSLKEVADVILPLAPLAESEGSMVNFDGQMAVFSPAGKPVGEARPGWKLLRRLGAALELEGFDFVSLAGVQQEMLAAIEARAVTSGEQPVAAELATDKTETGNGLYRVGEVPMYSVDALCRRADALQRTVHAQSAFVGLNPADASRLGLSDGGRARVRQGEAHAELDVRVTEQVPAGAAWLRSASCSTRELGEAIGPLKVEVA